jgi:hypothetical protein
LSPVTNIIDIIVIIITTIIRYLRTL